MDTSKSNRALRIAIIFDEKEVFVEFNPDTFRELLSSYLKDKQGDSNLAMDAIERDLRKQTLYK